MNVPKNALAQAETEALLAVLEARFEQYSARHEGIAWQEVRTRLASQPEKLRALSEMERTGGEPDVMGEDPDTGEFIFADFAPESPAGRRNLCYDRAALDARKNYKPENSAMDMASEMGIALMTEDEYRGLQKLGAFDRKTSSWLRTPDPVRKLGGALFGDRRYDRVFIYHNGADSYYGVRGFRGILRV